MRQTNYVSDDKPGTWRTRLLIIKTQRRTFCKHWYIDTGVTMHEIFLPRAARFFIHGSVITYKVRLIFLWSSNRHASQQDSQHKELYSRAFQDAFKKRRIRYRRASARFTNLVVSTSFPVPVVVSKGELSNHRSLRIAITLGRTWDSSLENATSASTVRSPSRPTGRISLSRNPSPLLRNWEVKKSARPRLIRRQGRSREGCLPLTRITFQHLLIKIFILRENFRLCKILLLCF